MKKIIAIACIAGIIFACNQINKTSAPNIYNQFCSANTSGNLCSVIPIDVNESFGVGYDSSLDSIHQPPFDVLSWQTFVALNWPADSTGKPVGTSVTDSANAPRVWEHYKDPAEVFGHPIVGLTFRLGVAKKSGQKFFYMDSKSPHPLLNGKMLDLNKLKGFQEADGHPLIDRNLNFALYEIKMNPIESSFVVDSGLTTLPGIYKYGIKHNNAVNLPTSDSAANTVGSMEIKAAWRILVPALGDDTSRYYCRTATIFIDSAHTRNHKNLILTHVKVGLVGMHIIRKTAKMFANQIWTTFEHVDNSPDNPQEAQQGNKRWSFYNQGCLNCLPNKYPDTLKGDSGYVWEVKMPYAHKYGIPAPSQVTKDSFGSQAIRVYPIYKYTEILNQLWREKLKGSVWANYKLVGSQWRKDDNPTAAGPTAPNFLANTTLETYIQNDASCINCHNFASVSYQGTKIKTDMSFLFYFYTRPGAGLRKNAN